jgi:hypothetical protein
MGEHIFFEEELFMTKGKKFFLGMAVLLMSASLFLVGCGDPADGMNGAPGSHNLNGGPSVAGVQAAIDAAVATGGTVFLDNVTVTAAAAAIIDFKTANVTVIGPLTTAGAVDLVINAAEANVTLGADAALALGESTHLFIKKPNLNLADTGSGDVVDVVTELPENLLAGSVTAVKDLKLGAADSIIDNLTVYVYGTLTVDDDSALLTGSGTVVKAIGKVNVTETNAVALSDDTVVDYSNAVITSSKAVTINLGAAVTKAAFDIANGRDISLHADVLSIADTKIDGEGTLKVLGPVTDVATSGTGNIAFPNATGTITVLTLGNTGTIAFGHSAPLTIDDVTATFDGNATFASGIALAQGGKVVFNGDATLATTTKIASAAATSDAVTLKSGKAIKVGNATASTTLLQAQGGDITLTPGGTSAELTVTAAASPAPAKLAVGGQDVTIGGTGTAVVYGELDASAKDVTVGSTVSLAVAAGAKVTTNTGTIILGDATNGVILDGNGSWTAGGAANSAIVLRGAADASSISYATQGTTSTPGTFTASGTAPNITVKDGASATNVLTIGEGTVIELGVTSGAAVGSITLTAATTKFGQVTLTDASSVIQIGGTSAGVLSSAVGLFVIAAADNKLLCNALSSATGVAVHKSSDNKLVKITGGSAASTMAAEAGSGSGNDIVINAASAVN